MTQCSTTSRSKILLHLLFVFLVIHMVSPGLAAIPLTTFIELSDFTDDAEEYVKEEAVVAAPGRLTATIWGDNDNFLELEVHVSPSYIKRALQHTDQMSFQSGISSNGLSNDANHEENPSHKEKSEHPGERSVFPRFTFHCDRACFSVWGDPLQVIEEWKTRITLPWTFFSWMDEKVSFRFHDNVKSNGTDDDSSESERTDKKRGARCRQSLEASVAFFLDGGIQLGTESRSLEISNLIFSHIRRISGNEPYKRMVNRGTLKTGADGTGKVEAHMSDPEKEGRTQQSERKQEKRDGEDETNFDMIIENGHHEVVSSVIDRVTRHILVHGSILDNTRKRELGITIYEDELVPRALRMICARHGYTNAKNCNFISAYVQNAIQDKRKLIEMTLSRINQVRHSGLPLRLVLGAHRTVQPGWISTDLNTLDITDANDWEQYGLLDSEVVDSMMGEHVVEHLTLNQAIVFASLAHGALRPGGRLRLAVPDTFRARPQCFPSPKMRNAAGYSRNPEESIVQTVIRGRSEGTKQDNEERQTKISSHRHSQHIVGSDVTTKLGGDPWAAAQIQYTHRVEWTPSSFLSMLRFAGFDKIQFVEGTQYDGAFHTLADRVSVTGAYGGGKGKEGERGKIGQKRGAAIQYGEESDDTEVNQEGEEEEENSFSWGDFEDLRLHGNITRSSLFGRPVSLIVDAIK